MTLAARMVPAIPSQTRVAREVDLATHLSNAAQHIDVPHPVLYAATTEYRGVTLAIVMS
jgi:hypothetical protein